MSNKSRVFSALIAVAFAVGGLSASHAATLRIVNGELVGASDVNVNGQLYTVDFVAGDCPTVFDGCDDNSDFDFSSNDAWAAAQALVDQVFVNTGTFSFDDDPELTFGCSDLDSCAAIVPWSIVFSNETIVTTFAAKNSAGSGRDNASTVVFLPTLPNFVDPGVTNTHTYARFTAQPQVVPLPAAAWVFLAGVAGLMGVGKRKTMQR